MKFVLAFLAIFLLATTFAAHSKSASKAAASEAATREAAASLRRLSTTKLGKTLIDTLQLEIRSNTREDPRPRILRLLNEIKDETQSQLVALSDHIAVVRQECQATQDGLEETIENLEEDIESVNAQQAALQDSLNNNNQQLAAKQEALESLTTVQYEFTMIRQGEQLEFNNEQEKYERLVSILEQTRAFIYDRLQQRGNALFLQKNNILVEIKRRVMTPEFQTSTPGWSKFIHFLATKALEKLRQTPDDEAAVSDLSNIINVIDDVRERLSVANADAVALEDSRQASYDASNADLQNQIDSNNADASALQAQIANDEAQVASNADRLANDESDLDNSQEALNESQSGCQAADEQYADQYQQTQDEAEVIQEVIDIVENDLTNLRSAVETAVVSL